MYKKASNKTQTLIRSLRILILLIVMLTSVASAYIEFEATNGSPKSFWVCALIPNYDTDHYPVDLPFTLECTTYSNTPGGTFNLKVTQLNNFNDDYWETAYSHPTVIWEGTKPILYTAQYPNGVADFTVSTGLPIGNFFIDVNRYDTAGQLIESYSMKARGRDLNSPPTRPPLAGFSYSQGEKGNDRKFLTNSDPKKVLFFSMDELATSWLWDFGDGITSTELTPLHKYKDFGTYTVTLMTTNIYGSATKKYDIAVLNKL